MSIPNYKDNVIIRFEQTLPDNSDTYFNYDDISDIPQKNTLSEIDILANIYNRSFDGLFFTELDNVLLILNTFSNLESIYSNRIIKDYKEYNIKSEPHLYKKMRTILNEIFNKRINQSVIFQGVIGSGKTTSFVQSITCIIEMLSETKYLTNCPTKREGIDIGMILLKSLNIIKAFGSAFTKGKAPRSRYICNCKLSISSIYKKIKGGELSLMLLNKDRVVNENTNESNYLIFYYLLNAEATLVQSLYLTNDYKNYHFLDVVNNGYLKKTPLLKNRFLNIQESFESIGFSSEIRLTIYKILAAIIKLGNLPFDKKDLCNKRSTGDVDCIAKLLGVSQDSISNILIKTDYHGNYFKNSKNTIEVKMIYQRNVFAKELYSRLLDWIMLLINEKICPIYDTNINTSDKLKICNLNFLDIGGYEDNMKGENTLEQLCFNYINEKIHQLYSENVIQKQIEVYKKEELTETIKLFPYYDYKDFISLFENNMNGIFPAINQTSITNGTSEQLLEELKTTSKLTDSLSFFTASKVDGFTVNHTEGAVSYQMKELIRKNVEGISSNIYECIQSSIIEEIQMMFYNYSEYPKVQTAKNKLGSEINYLQESNYLLNQIIIFVNRLLKEITSRNAKLNFIKCIRSNSRMEGLLCSQRELYTQIKSLDLLNTIILIKQSYQICMSFTVFYENYRDTIDSTTQLPQNLIDKCLLIINTLISDRNPNAFLFGKNNILFKFLFYKALIDKKEALLGEKLIKANMIKKHFLSFIKQNQLKKWITNIKIIQLFLRNKKKMIMIKKKVFSALFIQKRYHIYINNKEFGLYLIQVTMIQKYWRRYLMKNTLNRIFFLKTLFIPLCRHFLRRVKETRRFKMTSLFNSLLDNVFIIITQKLKYKSSVYINSNIRRYLFQKHNQPFMRIVNAKILCCKQNVSAIRIQTNYRAQKVFMKYHYIHFATCFIRSVWKTSKQRRMLLCLKAKSEIIQRIFRTFLVKKRVYNKLLPLYLDDHKMKLKVEMIKIVKLLRLNEEYYSKEYKKETEALCNRKKSRNRFALKDKPDSSKDTMYESNRLNNKSQTYSLRTMIIENDNSNKDYLPEYLSFKETKIRLFTIIIDMDVITSTLESYDELWIKTYNNIAKQNMIQGSPIQLIKLGENFTCVINSLGKCFIWGQSVINDIVMKNHEYIFESIPYIINNTTPSENYLYRLPKEYGQIQDVTCAQDHCFIQNKKGNVYLFGKNGHHSVKHHSIPLLFLSKCKEIKTIGSACLDISQMTNEVCIWDYLERRKGLVFDTPIKLNLKIKAIVETISCGKEFAILLTKKGILYSLGTKNNKGELATGDYTPRFEPYPLLIFTENNEKIISVKCGFKHSLCLSANGKVFSWGSNSHGQLGLKETGNYPFPMKIDFGCCFNKSNRITQITCGFCSSFFMNENRSIGYCGKIALGTAYLPEKINLRNLSLNHDLTNDKLFTPIRLMSSFNNSFSLFYITYADLRSITNNKTISTIKLTNFLLLLSLKWNNSKGKSIHLL